MDKDTNVLKTLVVIILVITAVTLVMLWLHDQRVQQAGNSVSYAPAPRMVQQAPASAAGTGTCVIGPMLNSGVEKLGKGVINSDSVCDASDGNCGVCWEQCMQYDKIKDHYGCETNYDPDGWCNPNADPPSLDPDCEESICDNNLDDDNDSLVDCDDPGCSTNAACIEPWIRQTSGITSTLMDVDFVDVNTGWAVSLSGDILHTANGGTTWTLQNSGTTEILRDVEFVDSSNGWVVGGGGTILHTTNGGTTWLPQTSGVSQTIHDIEFVNANNGWAVGVFDEILSTIDGGANWNSESNPAGASILFGIHFLDDNNGWIVGDVHHCVEGERGCTTVLATSNGGASWTQIATQDSALGGRTPLSKVHFLSLTEGWAFGRGAGHMHHTLDGGVTWPEVQVSATGLSAMHWQDSDTSWAVFMGISKVIKTVDAGGFWTAYSTGSGQGLLGVDFVDGSTGWAVGLEGTILKTTTGGE